MSNIKHKATLIPILAICAFQSEIQASAAPEEGARVLEQIVVTAQRREQTLQDVPISVNAISGDSLKGRGIDSLGALSSAVPALAVPRVGSVVTPFLRGVGSNAADPNNEASVATYVDGIYMAAPFANVFSFNNIERIEVLKGPQGTLFGRNATGGVIQVVTRDPVAESFYEASIGYAKYDTVSGGFYGTTGLGSSAAIDLAIQFEDQGDGWGKNVVTGNDVYKGRERSIRSKLSLEPLDTTRILLSVDHFVANTSIGDYQLRPGVPGLDGEINYHGRHNTTANVDYNIKAESTGAMARIEHELSFAELVSLTSYRDSDGRYGPFDSDAAPVNFVTATLNQSVSTITQEFQLIGYSNVVDWSLGAYYFDNKAKYDPGYLEGLAIGADPLSLVGVQDTESWSLYGQATVDIGKGFALTGGLRYTDEDQTFDSSANGFGLPKSSNGFEEWTWRTALEYRASPDILYYLSYNRGIKSGGFDLLSPGDTGFDPEILDAYEIGMKAELLDNRLRLNTAVFYYDYEDIQVTSIQNSTTSTANAAGAKIKGVDVDLEAILSDQLTLSVAVSYLDGEYTDYPDPVIYPASPIEGPVSIPNAKGNQTIRTPELTGNIAATYRIPTTAGEFLLTGNVSYNDGYYWAPDERLRQPSHTLVNASLEWNPDDRFGVVFWGRNLTDKTYLLQGVPSAYGDLIAYASPRTYGVTFNFRY